MVITSPLREVLNRLGAPERVFKSLEHPSQRTKGKIALELTTSNQDAALEQLRQVPGYNINPIPGLEAEPGKTVLAVTIIVDMPFVRGLYRSVDGLYECRSLVTLPGFEIQVVMWRSAYKPEEGVMVYADWVEAVMRGELKLVSAY